jgi:glycosyltransferase involved in cell wall biosynthesis
VRVLFAIAFSRWSGVHSWMTEMGEALKARGHSITIAAPRGHPVLERAASRGLDACDRAFGTSFLAAPGWMRELRQRGVELVITNTSRENRTVGFAARLLGIPVLQRVGLARDLCRNTPTTRFERRWIVRNFLIICESMGREIREQYPYIDGTRLITINPGKRPCQPQTSRESLQRHLGLSPHAINGVICSQLTDGKGHLELLQAIAQLRPRGITESRFHLSIFHDGVLRPRLEACIRDYGLDRQVKLRGFCENSTDLLAAFDIGFLPSHWESLSNSLREYMMAGLCPIVSDLPGSTDVIASGVNGWIHRLGDADQIAQLLQRALECPEQTAVLGARAKADASARFDLAHAAAQMEALFQSHIEGSWSAMATSAG